MSTKSKVKGGTIGRSRGGEERDDKRQKTQGPCESNDDDDDDVSFGALATDSKMEPEMKQVPEPALESETPATTPLPKLESMEESARKSAVESAAIFNTSARTSKVQLARGGQQAVLIQAWVFHAAVCKNKASTSGGKDSYQLRAMLIPEKVGATSNGVLMYEDRGDPSASFIMALAEYDSGEKNAKTGKPVMHKLPPSRPRMIQPGVIEVSSFLGYTPEDCDVGNIKVGYKLEMLIEPVMKAGTDPRIGRVYTNAVNVIRVLETPPKPHLAIGNMIGKLVASPRLNALSHDLLAETMGGFESAIFGADDVPDRSLMPTVMAKALEDATAPLLDRKQRLISAMDRIGDNYPVTDASVEDKRKQLAELRDAIKQDPESVPAVGRVLPFAGRMTVPLISAPRLQRLYTDEDAIKQLPPRFVDISSSGIECHKKLVTRQLGCCFVPDAAAAVIGGADYVLKSGMQYPPDARAPVKYSLSKVASHFSTRSTAHAHTVVTELYDSAGKVEIYRPAPVNVAHSGGHLQDDFVEAAQADVHETLRLKALPVRDAWVIQNLCGGENFFSGLQHVTNNVEGACVDLLNPFNTTITPATLEENGFINLTECGGLSMAKIKKGVPEGFAMEFRLVVPGGSQLMSELVKEHGDVVRNDPKTVEAAIEKRLVATPTYKDAEDMVTKLNAVFYGVLVPKADE